MGDVGALALNPWTAFAALLITSGFGKYLIDLYREQRARRASAPPPTPARQAEIDQSLLTMAKANERLEDDVERLRRERSEDEERVRRERTEWAKERETYLREIRSLREEVRTLNEEIVKAQLKGAELGARLDRLSEKHDTGDIPAVKARRADRADQQTTRRQDQRRPYQPYDHSHGTANEIRED